MSPLALALVLISAALHATWNYHLKKANANKVFWPMVYVATLLITAPLLLIFDPQSLTRITAQGWLVIALSAPLHIVYGYILQHGYKVSDYSVVYPTARGMGPFITVIAAIVLIGNRPTVLGYLGILSVIIGVFLLAMKPGAQLDKSRTQTGILWGMITGCFIAMYSFCDAWAVQQATGLTPFSFYVPSILIRVLIIVPICLFTMDWRNGIRDNLTDPVKRKALCIVTIGSPGAYVMVLVALTMAPLAYVAPGREVGMMAGVIIGAVLLKEKLSALKILGVCAMVLGVILIGLAK